MIPHALNLLAEMTVAEALTLASLAVAVFGVGGLGGMLVAVGSWRTTLRQVGQDLHDVKGDLKAIRTELTTIRVAQAEHKAFHRETERRLQALEKAVQGDPT